MKSISFVLTALTMTLSSFTTPRIDARKDVEIAAEKMALRVVAALRKQSAFDYSTLYPTLDGFNEMFDETAAFYGHNFTTAKEEFEGRYLTQVVPSLNESFKNLIADGKSKGLDWTNITLSTVKVDTTNSDSPVQLEVESSGVRYTIHFAKTLMMDGELKVSSNVSLEKS